MSSRESDDVILWLAGELDLATRAGFTDAVSAVPPPDAQAIVVDVTGLIFIDSAGISSMVQCRNSAAAASRAFRVRDANGAVETVLAITGAGRVPRHLPLSAHRALSQRRFTWRGPRGAA